MSRFPASGIYYFDTIPEPELARSKFVRIPAGITRKRQLLTHLAHGLQFPDYFGWNWDALEECLRDLSWLEKTSQVILFHEALPFPERSKNREIYLEILSEAIQAWGPTSPHKLIVVFPPAEETEGDASA